MHQKIGTRPKVAAGWNLSRHRLVSLCYQGVTLLPESVWT